MRKKLIWMYFLAMFLIAGCATPQNAYVPPTGDPTTLAVIQTSSVRSGVFDWESYLIRAIDNQPVSYNCFGNCQWAVTPGEHVIVVEVQFNRSLGGGPHKSLGAVPIVVKPGKVYVPTGTVQNDQFAFEFVEQATRERVGGPVLRAFVYAGSSPTYIPMVAPK